MPEVREIASAEAAPGLLLSIRDLLVESFEGDFTDADWEHTLGGWHVIVVDGDAVVAHAAVVPRVLEVADRPLRVGYVEGVATALARQRQGMGSIAMVGIAEVLQRELEMGALSTSRHGFFERLGWERWQGPTFVRRGTDVLRTEEEDAGVMVLRVGVSADVDLSAPLTCEARPGDDW